MKEGKEGTQSNSNVRIFLYDFNRFFNRDGNGQAMQWRCLKEFQKTK